MIDHGERARALFLSGMTCAQAVLCAFEDETGLDRDLAMRMASGFGAGLGGLREVCGTLTGAILALGVIEGWTEPGDFEAKRAHYARVRLLAERVRQAEGSIVCRELLAAAGVSPRAEPSRRTGEYYKKRPCPELAAEAARLLEALLAEPEAH